MARQITITTPLGEDLVFVSMTGQESLGRLFQFDVVLNSTKEDIDINQLLGQAVTIRLETDLDEPRYFNGIVGECCQNGREPSGYAQYVASVHPWMWLLTKTSDCRIFQQKTVPDILKEVFADNGFSDYENALSNSYPVLEYCVQYRETDFNFVSRLMESEGIYYFFKHEEGKHTLVLADGHGSHSRIPGQSDIAYHLTDTHLRFEEASVSHWVSHTRLQSGSFAFRDYDFKKPKSDLSVHRTISREHAHASNEMYDYAGGYTVVADGEQRALTHIEELQVHYQQAVAATDARSMMTGGLFALTEHPRVDQNKEYLVVSCDYELVSNQTDTGTTPEPFRCRITVLDSKTPYRSPRTTPKPTVHGPNSAVVVGPPGEEIYPDEYGRVKVQFHWDRYGTKNEKSSCWIRVAQTSAGAKWGAQFIPRIGQEVMVDFFEGDPDRPIITGRVYNADNMPPYALPANKTQSGIKTRSSPGGSDSNFNEIRMEDKKGSEELFIQAEKDRTVNVKNNNTETVGADEAVTVGKNQTLSVGENQTKTIGSNQTETVGENQTESVGGNRTRTVTGSESVTVSKNRTHTVAINEMITVGAAQEITVGGLQAISVGAAQAITVGAGQKITVVGVQSTDIGVSQSVSTGADQSIDVGANRSVNVAQNETVKVGKNLVIDAGDAITIKCGKATISMKKDGTIDISGKNITVNGGGKMDLKASKDLTMKGKKILQN